MKSFFKKLAFVMALAMVVSLAAPAGSALAANALRVVDQTTNEVYTELTLAKVGDSKDLKYWDYKGTTPWYAVPNVWESSNTDVATVDNAGVVTAVAEGEATVSITLGDYTGSVKVIVGEKVVEVLPTATVAATPTEAAPTPTEAAPTPTEAAPTPTEAAPTPTEAAPTPTEAAPTPTEEAPKPTVAPLTPVQKTATKVAVTFDAEHTFDLTGTEAGTGKTVKIYRVFSTEEMAKMQSTTGFMFDGAGNGYQAHYIMKTDIGWANGAMDYTTWVFEGYNEFVHEAKYAVVYGSNSTSSEFAADSVMEFFTAYVGKVARIEITATDATVENDVEPAVPAYLTTTLYNKQGIDLTDYYDNAEETDYEIEGDESIASVSGNEVIFDEAGRVLVKGTYTFYDEDLEDDQEIPGYTWVEGSNYKNYKVDSIYAWTLDGGTFAAPKTSLIAGDDSQLFVIVKDNRGNYYTNKTNIGVYKIDGKQVGVVGDGNEDTAFEQYGLELVFDSLDPDSLLVSPDGAVETYTETTSFAVVSYKDTNDEKERLTEIGVMGINVTEARRFGSISFGGTSLTLLAETEAEDGVKNVYASEFKLSDKMTVSLKNQYGGTWPEDKDGNVAEDASDLELEYVVTTTKDAFEWYADDLQDDLNLGMGQYTFHADMFEDTNTTSVTFKVKFYVNGELEKTQNIIVKLDKPKYEVIGYEAELDANGEQVPIYGVYVDPNRADLSVSGIDMYFNKFTTAKLYQVSKANQQVGFVRTGVYEINLDTEFPAGEVLSKDEDRAYYIANDLTKNFVLEGETYADFLSCEIDGVMTYASSSALDLDDYVLVVTDKNNNVVPALGVGYGKNKDVNIGIEANDAGTGYVLNLAYAKNGNGEMVYAADGAYTAKVYKITNIVDNKDTGITKIITTAVSSTKFTVSKGLPTVKFWHQETTKDVVGVDEFVLKSDVIQAISETMTFKINGTSFMLVDNVTRFGTVGTATYKANDDYKNLAIAIDDVDYKIQKDGKRAVVNTVTFKVGTPAGGHIFVKVNVGRSINIAE